MKQLSTVLEPTVNSVREAEPIKNTRPTPQRGLIKRDGKQIIIPSAYIPEAPITENQRTWISSKWGWLVRHHSQQRNEFCWSQDENGDYTVPSYRTTAFQWNPAVRSENLTGFDRIVNPMIASAHLSRLAVHRKISSDRSEYLISDLASMLDGYTEAAIILAVNDLIRGDSEWFPPSGQIIDLVEDYDNKIAMMFNIEEDERKQEEVEETVKPYTELTLIEKADIEAKMLNPPFLNVERCIKFLRMIEDIEDMPDNLTEAANIARNYLKQLGVA